MAEMTGIEVATIVSELVLKGRCPMCCSTRKVLLVGITGLVEAVGCPECAGGTCVPASADDHLAEKEREEVAA